MPSREAARTVRALTVFFPVYNEGKSAGSLVARVDAECRRLGRPHRILVVDDGSSDTSVAEVRAAGAAAPGATTPLVLLEHGRNRGLRAALTTGIEWLARELADDEVAILMDGDDTHDPRHFEQMLKLIEGGADVVIASRFRKGSEIHGVPRYRQVLSLGANVWGMLFFHLRGVRDYACGYRAIHSSALKAVVARHPGRLLELERWGFICSVELLVKLGDVTKRFAEVPMVLRYDRKEGASKMNALRTVLGYGALFLHRLRSRS